MTVDREHEALVLFDRRAWRRHRERAARQGAIDFLHAEVSRRLIDRLDDIRRQFAVVLDLGVHTGSLSTALARRAGIAQIITADPATAFLPPGRGLRVAVDPELIPFRDRSFDLAVSALVLHWVADLPGALIQLRRALRPDGLLLAAMLGAGTLAELRTALIEAELAEEGGASPRVSPGADLAAAAALLQRAGFALPVADVDTITVLYPDLLTLLRELRGMGETNALAQRRRAGWRRATLTRAAAIYGERFGRPDGHIPATFEIVYLTGWAPAPSQPRPLPPGSATRRLAQALGTAEIPAGDKAAPPPKPPR